MITSMQNIKIQRVRALLSRRQEREEQQTFVVEGVRLVEEALLAGWIPEFLLYSKQLSDRGQGLIQKFSNQKIETIEIDERLMTAISDTETPQGILAVLPITKRDLPFPLDFLVILDQIRDPGNMGTVMRTAAAAGVQAMIISPGTMDVFAPKVVRSAMGAHFRTPIYNLDWTEIEQFCKKKQPVPLNLFLAESGKGIPFWKSDLKAPLAIIIGGEAEGASLQARRLADSHITIPMPGKSESINAAAAASILIFEVVRQRIAG
jgi:RNA methyltransferase, TrmH family